MIGETDDDLAQLCRTVGQIKRSLCRQEAVWRFSIEAMVLDYERAYRRVIAQVSLTEPPALARVVAARALELEPEA
jgi:hypothetical protein